MTEHEQKLFDSLNSNCPHVIDTLSSEDDIEILSNIVSNPSTPEKLLIALSNDPDIGFLVAHNESSSEKVLETLLLNNHISLEQCGEAIINHKNTTPKVLCDVSLFDTSHDTDKISALYNQKYRDQAKRILATTKEDAFKNYIQSIQKTYNNTVDDQIKYEYLRELKKATDLYKTISQMKENNMLNYEIEHKITVTPDYTKGETDEIAKLVVEMLMKKALTSEQKLEKRLLSTKDIENLYNISVSQQKNLRGRIKDPLPFIQGVENGKIQYDPDEVDAFFKKHKKNKQ